MDALPLHERVATDLESKLPGYLKVPTMNNIPNESPGVFKRMQVNVVAECLAVREAIIRCIPANLEMPERIWSHTADELKETMKVTDSATAERVNILVCFAHNNLDLVIMEARKVSTETEEADGNVEPVTL